VRALGVSPAEGRGSAGREAPSMDRTHLGLRAVRREGVPGVATGRTSPAEALGPAQGLWQAGHQKRLRAARSAVRISPPQMWQGRPALRYT
jgi:hypothetical protein